jgi:hypothetical protein
LGSAQCKAFEYPDIDWRVMVLNYKNAYHDIKDEINKTLDDEKFIADVTATFLTPDQAKNTMFDRVMNSGKRFSLVFMMNDIIQYHISNPYTKNVNEIARKLINNKNLKIFKQNITQGCICLIGKTSLGLTYEICVWTTLMLNWAKWVNNNPNVSATVKKDAFIKTVSQQKELDNGISLR